MSGSSRTPGSTNFDTSVTVLGGSRPPNRASTIGRSVSHSRRSLRYQVTLKTLSKSSPAAARMRA